MNAQNKSKEELINELQELWEAHNALKVTVEADSIAQKQTMEALQASEERVQLLFNKAPLGYKQPGLKARWEKAARFSFSCQGFELSIL